MTSTTRTAASASVTQTFSIARLDELAVVGADDDLHAFGQGRADLLGHRLGRLGDGQRVGARLADDAEADRRIAVEAEGGIGIFRALLDPGDVAEADQIAVGAAADDQLRGIARRVCERPVDAQGDVLLRAIRAGPAGSSTFWRRSAFSTSAGGQAEGGQPLGPHPHPHRRPRLAADEDPGDAVDRGEAVDAGCGRPSR